MILGIIAAAGQASRISGIPKFLLPLTGNDNYLLNRTINIRNYETRPPVFSDII